MFNPEPSNEIFRMFKSGKLWQTAPVDRDPPTLGIQNPKKRKRAPKARLARVQKSLRVKSYSWTFMVPSGYLT